MKIAATKSAFKFSDQHLNNQISLRTSCTLLYYINYRKRFNPLFDNRDSDKSAMTASVVSSKADKNCMLPVWCVLHAIIASIAIAALVIAALTRTQCMNTTPSMLLILG